MEQTKMLTSEECIVIIDYYLNQAEHSISKIKREVENRVFPSEYAIQEAMRESTRCLQAASQLASPKFLVLDE